MTSTFLPFPCVVFLSATEFSECVSHMKVNLLWVTADIKTVSFRSPGCPGTVLPQPSVGVRDPGKQASSRVTSSLSFLTLWLLESWLVVKKMAPTWTLVCNLGIL